jgi:hypothetical protein
MYTREQIAQTPNIGAVVMQGGKVWYLDAAGRPQRRLGVGTATGEAIGSSLIKVAAATGPAAPFVAAAGAIIDAISSFFGGGCGQACIKSATLEQVPEVALDDLHAVAIQQPGAISQSDFQTAYTEILNYGVQQLQNLEAQGDKRAAGGITNLQKSTDYSSFIASLPANRTVALNLSQAQTAFTNPSAAGWEPGSVSAGNALALQVLQSIAASGTASSTGVSGTVNALSTATGLPEWALLLGGAALLWTIL